jgi:hypothetical protein
MSIAYALSEEPSGLGLEQLCVKKQISQSALMRQSLRLYQLIEVRLERGERLFAGDGLSKADPVS